MVPESGGTPYQCVAISTPEELAEDPVRNPEVPRYLRYYSPRLSGHNPAVRRAEPSS